MLISFAGDAHCINIRCTVELKTARLTLLVDPAKKAAFERLCAQQDLTPSQVVRQLIREYLAQHGVTYVPSGSAKTAAAQPARKAAARRPSPSAAPRPETAQPLHGSTNMGIETDLTRWLLLDWAMVLVIAWLLIGLARHLGAAPLRLGRAGAVSARRCGRGAAVGRRARRHWSRAPQVAVLAIGLPTLPFHLRLDALSAFFLMVIGATSAGVSAFAAGYFRQGEGTPPGLMCLQYHVFLASMAGVVLADDAYAFMVMWETMALSSFFLVTSNHRVAEIRRAGYLYLLMAHVGAIGILMCFGVLQANTGDYSFANMRAQQLTPFWASVAFALALFGFGAKAGLLPLHVWLPEAHPAAPSPVSALMSGVMLKTAIYGLLRVLFDLQACNSGGGACCCSRSAWPRRSSAWSSPPCRST